MHRKVDKIYDLEPVITGYWLKYKYARYIECVWYTVRMTMSNEREKINETML